MQELLISNSLLLLFLVAAIGYLIGNIPIKGNKLGLAAVLFVGLVFGASNSNYQVPSIIFELGLVLFVYSIGLGSGPAFFKSFKRNGFRDISFILLMLTISAFIAVAVFFALDFSASTIVGLYSGSTTNTPALAGAIDLVNNSMKNLSQNNMVEDMVVAYTYSYPMGVLGVMIAIVFVEKLLKIDYKRELVSLKKNDYPVDKSILSKGVRVSNSAVFDLTFRDFFNQHNFKVNFGRMRRSSGETFLPNYDTKFIQDDELMIIGVQEELDRLVEMLGNYTDDSISYDRTEFDVRRIFVSNTDLAGKEIQSLNLAQKFNAVITRVRRGDMDMLARPSLVLELGDRIRFVAKREDLSKLSKYFGDSYYQVSKVNIFSFGIGIALGLLLGAIEFSFPGGLNVKLGFAGGPLIVGILLGSLRRTGPLVWTMPYGVNVTLQQLGLTLLLAAIGLKSGNTFVESLSSGSAVWLFAAGVIVSVLSAVLSLIIGFKLFKIPYSLLMGFSSNQPAILDFVMNRAGNKVPLLGYTMMFPIAMILKIIYAQLLFLSLS